MNPDLQSKLDNELELVTNVGQMDLKTIHAYLSRSYWAAGIPLEIVQKSMEHSLCFGVFRGGAQIAFARVVTDRATFAYLCDVFVIEAEQGRGVGKWMMERVMLHTDLQGLRRFSLATRDAHGLYSRFGFGPIGNPTALMEVLVPDIYLAPPKGLKPAD